MVTKVTKNVWPRWSQSESLSGANARTSSFKGPAIVGYDQIDDSVTGVENRNWKTQIREARNATTPSNGVRCSRYGIGPQYYLFGYSDPVQTSDVFCRRGSYTLTSSNLGFSPPNGSSNVRASCINEARTNFSKALERALTQFAGGTFLGELKETLHMIRRPGQALRRRVGDYLDEVLKKGPSKKRLPRNRRQAWLSNTWLEHSFGWVPLLNDLDDARKYLDRRANSLIREVVRISGRSGPSRELVSETNHSAGSAFLLLTGRVRTIDEFIVVLSGAVRSDAYGGGLINASAMGLHPRSFIPTLWEVLPWSFVADYFSNIGDVISGWSNQNAQLAWGRETVIETRTREYSDQRGIPSLAQIRSEIFISGDARMTYRKFYRNGISSAPVPAVSFEIPGFGLKWLNLAALARSRQSIRAIRLGD